MLVKFYHSCITCISLVQAIDFVDRLLRYDHQERPTAKEAMVITMFYLTISILNLATEKSVVNS